MSEEEKKAVEYWKSYMEILHWNTQLASEHHMKVLLDLIEKQQKELEQEKEKNKELEKAIKNSNIEILKDYIQYKIECFEKMLNGHIGDGARPEIQRRIDILKDILEEAN